MIGLMVNNAMARITTDLHIDRITVGDARDLIQLVQLFEVVFEIEPSPHPPIEYYKKILADPNFIVVVAKLEGEVIGGLTAYLLHGYHSARPVAYAHDLAVHPEHQRKGIGRRIMDFSIDHCRLNGFEELFIQAELDDDNAIGFYRSTPVSEELKALHFSYRL